MFCASIRFFVLIYFKGGQWKCKRSTLHYEISVSQAMAQPLKPQHFYLASCWNFYSEISGKEMKWNHQWCVKLFVIRQDMHLCTDKQRKYPQNDHLSYNKYVCINILYITKIPQIYIYIIKTYYMLYRLFSNSYSGTSLIILVMSSPIKLFYFNLYLKKKVLIAALDFVQAPSFKICGIFDSMSNFYFVVNIKIKMTSSSLELKSS